MRKTLIQNNQVIKTIGSCTQPIPNLPNRVKLTGWEHGFEYIGRELTDVIRKHANMSYQSFITWDYFTSLYFRKEFYQKF